jgi:hypothetical protein
LLIIATTVVKRATGSLAGNASPIAETASDQAWADYLEAQSRLTALPAPDNRVREVLELMSAGRAPYLAMGWLPFGNPR